MPLDEIFDSSVPQAGEVLDAETRALFERYWAECQPYLDREREIAEESQRMTAEDLAIYVTG